MHPPNPAVASASRAALREECAVGTQSTDINVEEPATRHSPFPANGRDLAGVPASTHEGRIDPVKRRAACRLQSGGRS